MYRAKEGAGLVCRLRKSVMSEWSAIQERSAGKWQIPLFALSLLALGAAIYAIRPQPKKIPIDLAVEQLQLLNDGGLYGPALEMGLPLLAVEGRTERQLASLYLELARAQFGAALQQDEPTPDDGRLVIDQYEVARRHGQTLTGKDEAQLGQACEWRGEYARAVSYYDQALAAGVDQPAELRQHVLQLQRDQLGLDPSAYAKALDGFLAALEPHRLDLRLWAIEQQLGAYEDSGNLAEAATLLTRNKERFADSDLADAFAYLEAYLLVQTGHSREAEPLLRAIRNRAPARSELNARTGWLLGRAVLSDGGPQRPVEAAVIFEDVITNHPPGPYRVASRLGRAEALVQLEQHDEALKAYRAAIDELATLPPTRLVNHDVLRVSLAIQAQRQQQEGDRRAALGYAELAAQLVDESEVEATTLTLERLGELQAALADELIEWVRAGEAEREALALAGAAPAAGAAANPTDNTSEPPPDGALFDGPGMPASPAQLAAGQAEAEGLYAAAAGTYLRLAQLNTLNEGRSAAASLRAAELMDQAGLHERAMKLFEEFARERAQHPLAPRALLRVGQLRRALGDLPGAIEAFQACYRRAEHSLDSSKALIPLAQCYFALGSKHDEQAAQTLRIVLEDSEVFTPQAPEFAEALFLLGDVLNRQGEFERAVTVLEEALERYPNDTRSARGRFVLADSYRRSALALKAELPEARFTGEIDYIREESAARLRHARELYRALIDQYELRRPDELSRLERVYYRHAYLYEADCYFEAGQYKAALKLYEEAAAAFQDQPSALSAYVQIINCHTFLGQPAEARAALARARILADAMNEDAFDRSVSPETRGDWKRYFDWLAESSFAYAREESP